MQRERPHLRRAATDEDRQHSRGAAGPSQVEASGLSHRLVPPNNRLEQETGRLAIILLHQTPICQHWRQVVAEDALVHRDEIVVLGGSCEVAKLCATFAGGSSSNEAPGTCLKHRIRALGVEHFVRVGSGLGMGRLLLIERGDRRLHRASRTRHERRPSRRRSRSGLDRPRRHSSGASARRRPRARPRACTRSGS